MAIDRSSPDHLYDVDDFLDYLKRRFIDNRINRERYWIGGELNEDIVFKLRKYNEESGYLKGRSDDEDEVGSYIEEDSSSTDASEVFGIVRDAEVSSGESSSGESSYNNENKKRKTKRKRKRK